ncbi:MAG: TIGR03435 family protein [Acidobacteriia bacterium]|nr:TIGR03435 family protein [Terriglobia bacterium]
MYNFIRDAYLSYPDGKPWTADTREEPSSDARGLSGRGCAGCGRGLPPISDRLFRQPLTGGPDWVNSDRYTIDAKAESPASPEMMRGPMMQALLEDRFKLKIHRENRVIPVYELRVAPGGPKLQASSDSSCFAFDPSKLPPRPVPGQAVPRFCGMVMMQKGKAEFVGTTLGGLCRNLSNLFDRGVIDKTGTAGLFDIRLDAERVVLTPDDLPADPPADGRPAPPMETDHPATFKSFQTAVSKIGLKLEPAQGSGVFLVIDHVERPSAN